MAHDVSFVIHARAKRSRLTWDAVKAFIAKQPDRCITNRRIVEEFEAPYGEVCALTNLMFAAGELQRGSLMATKFCVKCYIYRLP